MAIRRALVFLSLFPIPSALCGKTVVIDDASAKLANARSVFVSDVGDNTGDTWVSTGLFSSGANQPYNYLYAALQSWGRYQIVLDPADADLVLEPRYRYVPMGPKTFDLQLSLTVRDAKTGGVLKDFTESIGAAILPSTRQKNFAKATVDLLNDMSKAAGHPVATFTLPKEIPAAPVPIKILAAKKLFIAKPPEDRVHGNPKQDEQLYEQVIMTTKTWGQYELTATAQDADIIWIPSVYDSDVRLEISDAKTQILLWEVYQPVIWGALEKHMDEAAVALLNNAAQTAGKTLFVPNQGTWPPADDRIPVTISAPATVKTGAEVLAHVTVKNSANFDISFNYASGDPLTCILEVLDAGGKPVADTAQGSKLKVEHAGWQGQQLSYTLDPGETQTRDCAVSDLFDISAPGEYSIQARQLDGRAVKSNVVTVTVGH